MLNNILKIFTTPYLQLTPLDIITIKFVVGGIFFVLIILIVIIGKYINDKLERHFFDQFHKKS